MQFRNFHNLALKARFDTLWGLSLAAQSAKTVGQDKVTVENAERVNKLFIDVGENAEDFEAIRKADDPLKEKQRTEKRILIREKQDFNSSAPFS